MSKTKIYECIRIRPADGHRTVDMREGERMPMWIKYNQAFRGHYALFVDGICHHQGAMTKQACHMITKELNKAKKTK